jgi:hypothetical protein
MSENSKIEWTEKTFWFGTKHAPRRLDARTSNGFLAL